MSPVSENWLTLHQKGFFKCGHCAMCKFTIDQVKNFSYNSDHIYEIRDYMNCQSKYCVYVIVCKCGKIYVGSSIRTIQDRVAEHWRAVRSFDHRYPVALHAATCDKFVSTFLGIDNVRPTIRGGNRELKLRRQEVLWIMRLKAVEFGINIDNELHYFLGDR